WPRTPPFHGDNRGSNPLGDAISLDDVLYGRPLAPLQVWSEIVDLTGFGLDFDFPTGVSHLQRFGLTRGDGGLHELSVLPVERYFETAAGQEAADFARGERRRQCREEMQEAGLAALDCGQAGGSAVRVVA